MKRARNLASRLGVSFLPRRGGLPFPENGGSVYVVGRTREEVWAPNQPPLFVHPGLFNLKRGSGSEQPILRAVAPEGADSVRRIFDANLGLAGDAMHLSDALDVEVLGSEKSPVVAALLEEGLPRMAREGGAWSQAAARIKLMAGDALGHLRNLPDNHVEVVYLDPMMPRPLNAQAGFDVFRLHADHGQPDMAFFKEAARVARDRMVIKVPPKARPPHLENMDVQFSRKERGTAVDYFCADF
jgi:hypothetical protein